MKKTAVWMTALCAALIFGACADKTENTEGTETSTASETAAASDVTTEITAENYLALKDYNPEDYVTLGEYRGLAVTVAAAAVEESAVETEALSLYQSQISAENGGIRDRAVQDGDLVNIDFEGKKDGVAFEGGTSKGYNLSIGSGSFIEGFEEGLIGIMPGETVDLDLTFPETYGNADLAGAKVVFTVTVNYIVPTQMEDAVAAAFGNSDYTTVEELKEYVRKSLLEDAEAARENEIMGAVEEAFMNTVTFSDMPAELVEQSRKLTRSYVERQAEGYGIDADTLTSYLYGTDLETFLEEYGEKNVKSNMALMAVAKREGLTLTDEELEAELKEMAESGGYGSVEEMLGTTSREQYREYLTADRAIALLVENALVGEQ